MTDHDGASAVLVAPRPARSKRAERRLGTSARIGPDGKLILPPGTTPGDFPPSRDHEGNFANLFRR